MCDRRSARIGAPINRPASEVASGGLEQCADVAAIRWIVFRASLRSVATGAAIEATGAVLWYLPPCSPDFNPIEQCFARLKAILRAARCRSIETLWRLLGHCLARFSADECHKYFRHCGYIGR